MGNIITYVCFWLTQVTSFHDVIYNPDIGKQLRTYAVTQLRITNIDLHISYQSSIYKICVGR